MPEPKHDLPPHILHEIMELKEKVGRLEGMMDILLQEKHGACQCGGNCDCGHEEK